MPRYRLVITAATTVGSPRHYVALGDSYTSGPWIPEQRADPVGCQRSTSNYPARLAAVLHISDYTDVSCGGASNRQHDGSPGGAVAR
ncbi:MAG: hypothetical protein ACRDQ4_02855 [Pseudonocardiaceae bacterium]